MTVIARLANTSHHARVNRYTLARVRWRECARIIRQVIQFLRTMKNRETVPRRARTRENISLFLSFRRVFIHTSKRVRAGTKLF